MTPVLDPLPETIKTISLDPSSPPVKSGDPVYWSGPSSVTKARIPADYHILTEAEIQQIVPVFEAMGATLPDPAVSTIYGAVKNGRVVGFIVLQLCLHAEPMWIEPGHSEVFNGISRGAQDVVAEKCGGARVFLFADADKVARLSDINEFERITSPVYTKYIPAKAVAPVPEPEPEPDPDPAVYPNDSELEMLTRPDNFFEGGALDGV